MNILFAILPLAFIQNLGGWEVFAIVLVILLLFGGRKLPELARGAGKAIREFRKISSETEDTFKRAMNEEEEEAAKTRTAAQGTPAPASPAEAPKPAVPHARIEPEQPTASSENSADKGN